MDNYSLIMPFVDQSNSFTFGFACGQIWETMKMGKKIEGFLFIDKCRQQIEMICQANNYSYRIECIDDTCWCKLIAELTN